MNLKKVNDSIYSYEFEVNITKGLSMPVRSSFIKLKSSELLWYSPGPVDEKLLDAIEELGKVAYIVAPNLFHHIHLKRAQQAFPKAKCFVPKGLQEKKNHSLENIHIYQSFHDLGLIEDFDGTVLIHHTYLREMILLHKDSKTLLVADFCFNFDGNFKGFWMKIMMKLFGVFKGLHQSRLIKKTCKYPTEFLNDCQIVFQLSHKADSLLPAHGQYIEGKDFKEQWEKLQQEIEKRYS